MLFSPSHRSQGEMQDCSLAGRALFPQSILSPMPLLPSPGSSGVRGEGKIYSPKAENDKVSPNEQKHVELNFPKLLPCQRKQQLLVRGKRRT